MKPIIIAICYDFDGTLSPGNMQEYGFFSSLGREAKNFWQESEKIAKDNQADPILCYMRQMIEKAKNGNIPTTQKAMKKYGKDVKLFPGVESWFDRLNAYGKKYGVKIEHYIVSSGLKEIVEGSCIGKKFEKIYACSFLYDNNDVATWPAVAVNYTTKTQFIFRINKGIQDDTDNREINKYKPEQERRVPFARMIYLGDGATDVPCMKLVKDKGGTSIAVYEEGKRTKQQTALGLLSANRVNFVLPANYSENSRLEMTIKALIDRIVAENRVCLLANKRNSTSGKKKCPSKQTCDNILAAREESISSDFASGQYKGLQVGNDGND